MSSLDQTDFIVIGKITKPHGVHGELRVIPYTDSPERFEWLETVYVGDLPEPVVVESVRFHQQLVLIRLEGFTTREAGQRLRNALLQVSEADAIPLDEGEYFLYQLEGLTVVTDTGETLGKLTRVIETGANNVFEVQGDGGEYLLPDIAEVVLDIDFENGRMLVHILPGLIP